MSSAALCVLLVAGCGDSASASSSGAPETGELGDTASDDTAPDSTASEDTALQDTTSDDAEDDAEDGAEDDTEDGDDADGSSDASEDEDATDLDADAAAEDTAATDTTPRCTDRELTTFGPELYLGTVWTDGALTACAPAAHAAVVPRNARWEIQLRELPFDARVFVFGPGFARTDAAGDPPPPHLAQSDTAGADGEVELTFTAEVSGEHFVVIERDNAVTEGPYEARAVCREGCDLETTRYPLVLVHGYAGADNYFGLLEYFYDIPGPMRDRGYSIHTPVTDPVALSTVRAAQLAEQVDEVLRETGASKVNIIAHSQGGLDARLLISGLGYADRVASLTTVATPHLGVPAVLFEFVTVQSFSPEVMEEFNATYLDDPTVAYWSWSARSCSRLDFSCRREADGEVIELLLVAPFALLGRFGDNDGIVPTASMLWGEHLGRLNADHFDEIGQVADRSPDDDPFDHRAFYLSEARRLTAAGY